MVNPFSLFDCAVLVNHHSLAILKAILPLSYIEVTVFVNSSAKSIPFAILEFSLVDVPIIIINSPDAMDFSIFVNLAHITPDTFLQLGSLQGFIESDVTFLYQVLQIESSLFFPEWKVSVNWGVGIKNFLEVFQLLFVFQSWKAPPLKFYLNLPSG